MRKVLIIGAGIGGLTATLALRQAGFDVQVFEAVPEIKVVGAGLAIWSNALHALRQIGQADAVRAVGMPAASRVIRAVSGEVLTKVQVDQIGAGEDEPLLHLHRGDLQGVLMKAVGAATIQTGARCIDFRQDETGVWARFADDREIEGDLLVGADGVHSVIRQKLFSTARLRLVGQVSWRGLARIDDKRLAAGEAGETWGVGQRIGLIPMRHGGVYWFLTMNVSPSAEVQNTALEMKQHMQELVRGWHEPIPSMIQATEAQTIIRTDLNELEPLERWHRGRVVLLGDAAHAMTPNLGQGACQAIEDAVTLGQCLQAVEDVDTALDLYEKKRVERVGQVVADSRRFGEVAHDEVSPPCLLSREPFQDLFRGLYMEPLERIVRQV
jgi:2-polyprenyl-6-methoxyphenol hydroxylase-like FAD-dependent oxidoreductase